LKLQVYPYQPTNLTCEVNFFASGKVTIREVNDIDEGKKLVNSILAMVAQKQLLKEELK